MMLRGRVVWVLLLASCTSLTFDDAAPFASLRGSPPSTAGRQRLHRGPNEDLLFVRGVDGVPWATQDPLPTNSGLPGGLPWLVRLGDPADTLTLYYGSGGLYLTQGAVFTVAYDVDNKMITGSHLSMTRPGAPAVTFDFDTFIGEVVDSDNEAALYVAPAISEADPSGTGYIVRTDGSFHRSFDVEGRPLSIFDADGELLFTFDSDGVIRARSARKTEDTEIGEWSVASDSPPGASIGLGPQVTLSSGKLTVCDNLGLRTLEVTASPHVLDGDACVAGTLIIRRDHLVYYANVGQQPVLRSVPADGSAPPVALAHTEVPPLAADAERVAWTTRTPGASGLFSPDDVGDGWVDDKRFMERGRFVTFSADGRHLYFLEHAATGEGVGELRSYEIATGITHMLALNARRFVELPDGRLLAVTNAWTDDEWNRVVVIDEVRRTIDWVADGADGFTLIPERPEVLVDLPTSANEITMVRMPIP